MLSSVSITSIQPSALLEQGQKNSLVGRIKPFFTWTQLMLFSNTAMIITGIALACFMKLPMVLLGIGSYGILYQLLFLLSLRSRVLSSDARAWKEKAEHNHELLGASREKTKLLEVQLTELRNKNKGISELEEEKAQLCMELGRKKTEIQHAVRDLKLYVRAIDSVEKLDRGDRTERNLAAKIRTQVKKALDHKKAQRRTS